jgi:hypothetical protein
MLCAFVCWKGVHVTTDPQKLMHRLKMGKYQLFKNDYEHKDT